VLWASRLQFLSMFQQQSWFHLELTGDTGFLQYFLTKPKSNSVLRLAMALPCLLPKASSEEPSSSPHAGSSSRYHALWVTHGLICSHGPLVGPKVRGPPQLCRQGGQRPQQPLHAAGDLICAPLVTRTSLSKMPGWCLRPNTSAWMGQRWEQQAGCR